MRLMETRIFHVGQYILVLIIETDRPCFYHGPLAILFHLVKTELLTQDSFTFSHWPCDAQGVTFDNELGMFTRATTFVSVSYYQPF